MKPKEVQKWTTILLLIGFLFLIASEFWEPLLILGVVVIVVAFILQYLYNKCPYCGESLYKNYGNFCQHCGRKID